MEQKVNNGKRHNPKHQLTPAKARKQRNENMIVELYLQGNTMQRVIELMVEKTGHKFGIGTVHEYINKAVKAWQEKKAAFMENYKAIELENIHRLQSEYWQAWEQSKEALTTTRTKKVVDADKKLKKIGQDETERDVVGDSRFLKGVEKCIEMRMRLLGIDTPTVVVNQQNNDNRTNGNTTIIRKVQFRTRITTTAAQVIENPDNEQ